MKASCLRCVNYHTTYLLHVCRLFAWSVALRAHVLTTPVQVYLFIGKSLNVGLSELGALTLVRALVQVRRRSAAT
jgi:hypothetical protein